MCIEMNTTHKERLTVTVQVETKRHLEHLIPARQRSAFTEKALQVALQQEAKRRALAALENVPTSQSEGAKPIDSVTLVRQVREDMGTHLNKPHTSES